VPMYSLLIVEDERWEREGLVHLWDWHELGIEVAGTAVNGVDGLNQAFRLQPDIIVTDIRMPGLNGLEMSKKIREKLSDVRIVVLTGYSDYEYTREAIAMNADDYVLKPLEEDELRATMQRVVEKCDKLGALRAKEKRMLERLRAGERSAVERRLADLLHGRRGKPEELAAELLKLDEGLHAPGYAVLAAGASRAVDREALRRALGGRAYLLDCDDVTGGLAAVIPCEAADLSEAERMADRLMSEWSRMSEMQPAIGFGAPAVSLTQLRDAYREAVDAVRYGIFCEVSGVIPADTAAAARRQFDERASEFRSEWLELCRRLRLHVLNLQEREVRSALIELFAHIRRHAGAGRAYLDALFQALLFDLSLLEDERQPYGEADGNPLAAIGSVQELEAYLHAFVSSLMVRLDAKRNRKEDYIANRTVRLIEEKYGSNELSLTMLASEMFVSPNHLGVLFKRSKGVTVHQYILEVRMRKAEELLRTTKAKVSEIAERVGVANHSYFCTLFKQKHGMSPGEYQELMQRR
jgi:two-component system, response regulator YesN